MGKRLKKQNIYTASQIKKLNEKHPLCQPNPKNFRLGNSIRPSIVKSRFVRYPRYVQIQRQKRILLRRLKCPHAIAQFMEPLEKSDANQLFSILQKYSPETKKEKKERLQKEAKSEVKGEKKGKKQQGEKPVDAKCGLNHVTYLIEQKKAKMVLIAADVDPIETVVFLPTLCKSMDIPYAIVPSKARLGQIVHKKSATCLALTDFKEGANELNNLCKKFSEKFKGAQGKPRPPEKGYKSLKKEEKAKRNEIVEQNKKA
ncbi:MAG: ribosomal L7Ae/L30e/S12e/Gadd45 family protein [archaeon]|nr:ribosomal L7Ae/L30e/S12e/Gadd45 family protein [archaeon]